MPDPGLRHTGACLFRHPVEYRVARRATPYNARIMAFRRLLCRAALFLCISPLFAIRSMMGTAAWKAAVAAALSPLSMESTTFLREVRNMDRRELLCRRRLAAWRARFLAEAMLAKSSS